VALTVERLDATLGAVVTGVRVADLDEATWLELLDAFHEHAVLVLPDQHLTSEEQRAFARRFGPLEEIAGGDGLTPISNTTRDGRVRDEGDPVLAILRGNEGWHTDSSYMAVSATASILSAHVVTPDDGETEWADMRAAHDALDPALRERVSRLAAHHSIAWSQRRMGLETPPPGGFYGFDDGPEPLRPLVKVHPVTGRAALFIGRHAHAIPGLSDEESEALLDHLLEISCRPPFTHAHRWTPGDVAVWDNRCVLHRARPYDRRLPRVMKHSRVSGDPATESALPVS